MTTRGRERAAGLEKCVVVEEVVEERRGLWEGWKGESMDDRRRTYS